MFQGMMKAIKGERKMSFDHWRYRLLHWSFGVDPETPEESPLFSAFYSHYCPLFHVTNLLVLLFPVLFLFRTTWYVTYAMARLVTFLLKPVLKGLFRVGDFLGGLIFPYVDKVIENINEQCHQRSVDKAIHQKEVMLVKAASKDRSAFYNDMAKIVNVIKGLESEGLPAGQNNRLLNDFVYFCELYMPRYRYSNISEADIKTMWVEWTESYRASKKAKEEYEKEHRDRMVFWINFSRVFFKCGLNVTYACLLALVSWLLWVCVPPVVSFLFWAVTSIDYLAVAIWCGYGLLFLAGGILATGLIVGVAYLLSRVMIACRIWVPFIAPFKLVGYIGKGFFKWCGSVLMGVVEFVSMFYEDNCPPVKIVSKTAGTAMESA